MRKADRKRCNKSYKKQRKRGRENARDKKAGRTETQRPVEEYRRSVAKRSTLQEFVRAIERP